MASSFQKRAKGSKGNTSGIPGTKVSLHNSQLLISSGVPALDSLLGGGLTVGSVILLKEDRFSTYSNLLLQYFLAEGVVCGHSTYIAGADDCALEIIKDLPCPIGKDHAGEAENDGRTKDEELKIAWRYQHLPKSQSKDVVRTADTFGHYYDLTKSMPTEISNSAQTIKYCNDVDGQSNDESFPPSTNPYKRLMDHLRKTVKEQGVDLSGAKVEKKILRVALHSFGSPLWSRSSDLRDTVGGHELLRFLLLLKALMRSSLAVCVVTIPAHLLEDAVLLRRAEQIVDTVIELESFAGSDKEQNPLYKEYHGLFFIQKQTALNCLIGQNIDTSDMAFKLKRKKFAIEKLHLPPELADDASRSPLDRGSANAIKGHLPCSLPGSTSALDF